VQRLVGRQLPQRRWGIGRGERGEQVHPVGTDAFGEFLLRGLAYG
jgi:hypothetical protein